MTSPDPAARSDPPNDLWSRVRAYCDENPVPIPPWYRSYLEEGHGGQVYATLADIAHTRFLHFPPATEDQVRATEERLGFPLPDELRLLYTQVATGGVDLGPCWVFHGAIGGCGEYANIRPDGRTLEELGSESGWHLHPRIEEALLRHPDRYVVVDTLPDKFLWIAGDSDISTMLDPITGRLYYWEGWGDIPDRSRETQGGVFDLYLLYIEAPSLEAWFARWLDGPRGLPPDLHELLPEQVETADLADPEIVWRGLYRFGPEFELRPPDETEGVDVALEPDSVS